MPRRTERHTQREHARRPPGRAATQRPPDGGRPRPDEGPLPQPERTEPKLAEPRLRDLSRRDYVAIFKRAAKGSVVDGITDLAAALAYYSFMAIPSVMLVAIGVFTLVASPSDITALLDHLRRVVPSETISLLNGSLQRLKDTPGSSIVIVVVGFTIAIWSTTGAMTAFMRALNRAYDRKETRGFLRQRIVAVEMVIVMSVAFVLVFGLLVLGPQLSKWIGGALGIENVFGWLWWIAQWPVLVVGLLVAFATMLFLGPNVDHPRWQFLSPGAVVAAFMWIAASGLFAVYTSMFGSYNKAWGSLAAVIVMLTWLWLSSLALLFGAEVNAETERSRELRAGKPAEVEIQAPAKV